MEKYKCWDCRREIKNVHLDDETKEKCIQDKDGFRYIICDDCKDKEDY